MKKSKKVAIFAAKCFEIVLKYFGRKKIRKFTTKMTSLKAVVDHRKDDGTYTIKIRLTHNRQTLYIKTSYSVTERQLTKSKKIKDHNVIMACNKIIDEMREIIMSIEQVSVIPCDMLRTIINQRMTQGKVFRLNFINYARDKIQGLNIKNKRIHETAINYVEKYYGNGVDINEMTYNLVVSYRDRLLSEGLSLNTVILYLKKIKHLINMAKEEYNNDYMTRIKVTPFKRGVIPSAQPTEHRTLTAEQIRRIASIHGDRYENFAKDVFMLSFCLIGINMIDLFEMPTSAYNGEVLAYSRSKTRHSRKDSALICVKVEPEAEILIKKYEGDSQKLFRFYWKYVNHEKMTRAVNDFLKRLKKYDDSLPCNLTYYYARHTWATIAYNECGIDMQTIHEALNHASDAKMRITDIYVRKDFNRIWEANRKVLDFVFGDKKNSLNS